MRVRAPASLTAAAPGRAGAQSRASAGSLGALLARRWHRSLQLRVVGTTLVISAVVVAVLGFFLIQQIASGLLQNKERTAALLAADGVERGRASSPRASRHARGPGPASSMYALILLAPCRRSGTRARRLYDVVMLQRGTEPRHRRRARQTRALPAAEHPAHGCIEQVQADQQRDGTDPALPPRRPR